MTTPKDEKHHSGKKRASEGGGGTAAPPHHPPPPPPSSSKRKRADAKGGSDAAAVRIKVVRPAKASASAPSALAPFVGYLAHGRLGAAAKAAQTIAGGGGEQAAAEAAADPDGAKAASKVQFDVYEAPRRAPVYVAQLAGTSRGASEAAAKDDDDGDADAAAKAAAPPRLLLVGRTDGAEQNGAAAAGWYAVGVYSRSKGTLTLARAQDGRLARVEPVLPEGVAAAAAASAKRAADAAAAAAAAGDTAREQSRRLVDAFGSTRRKRQLQARDEGTVRSDRLLEGGAGVQAALARVNAAAAREGGTRDAVLARAAASRNVPPHDPAATRASDAYRVRAFFPPAFWDALNYGQLLSAAEDPEQMAKLRERRLVPGYVLSRCDALLRPGAAAAAGAAAGGGGSEAAAANSGGKDARRYRARLLAAVAALLSLHAGRASVRVPVGPGGLDDAARRLRICARGDALEALLELLYVPAGRVEGDDEAVVAAAAAAAEAEAAAKKAAIKREEGAEVQEEEGKEGAAAGDSGDKPTTPSKPPPRTPRPAADVFVRDDRQKALALAYALVIALEAEGWRMSPEAFEALRSELRVGARDLAARFRELGCDCVAASASAAGAGGGGGEGGGGPSSSSYSVSLLQRAPGAGDGGEPRTLESAFPKAKRPAAQRR